MNFVPVFEIISELLFMLYLTWAAYQDRKERLVLRGTHLLGLAAVVLYCVLVVIRLVAAECGHTDGAADGYLYAVLQPTAQSGHDLCRVWIARMAALLFCFLCEGIYRRFSLYGLADSLVFLNCSLYYWVRTDAFLIFFLFWWLKAFSGILFLAVQIARRRRLKWRLDEPAAYIPCILFAFALTNIGLKGYNV